MLFILLAAVAPGAFLIPYVISLIFMGLPVFLWEMSAGQFSSEGPISIWKICPLFQGLQYKHSPLTFEHWQVLVTECAFSPCTLVLTTTSFFPGHFFTSFPPSPHLYPGHLAATGGIRKVIWHVSYSIKKCLSLSLSQSRLYQLHRTFWTDDISRWLHLAEGCYHWCLEKSYWRVEPEQNAIWWIFPVDLLDDWTNLTNYLLLATSCSTFPKGFTNLELFAGSLRYVCCWHG